MSLLCHNSSKTKVFPAKVEDRNIDTAWCLVLEGALQRGILCPEMKNRGEESKIGAQRPRKTASWGRQSLLRDCAQ